MRTMMIAAVVALGAASASAGPSDHTIRGYGGTAGTGRTEVRRADRDRAPYALTGQRPQRRVLTFRDVPRGRGQFDRVAFYQWVSE
jgi:hypothetical protein